MSSMQNLEKISREELPDISSQESLEASFNLQVNSLPKEDLEKLNKLYWGADEKINADNSNQKELDAIKVPPRTILEVALRKLSNEATTNSANIALENKKVEAGAKPKGIFKRSIGWVKQLPKAAEASYMNLAHMSSNAINKGTKAVLNFAGEDSILGKVAKTVDDHAGLNNVDAAVDLTEEIFTDTKTFQTNEQIETELLKKIQAIVLAGEATINGVKTGYLSGKSAKLASFLGKYFNESSSDVLHAIKKQPNEMLNFAISQIREQIVQARLEQAKIEGSQDSLEQNILSRSVLIRDKIKGRVAGPREGMSVEKLAVQFGSGSIGTAVDIVTQAYGGQLSETSRMQLIKKQIEATQEFQEVIQKLDDSLTNEQITQDEHTLIRERILSKKSYDEYLKVVDIEMKNNEKIADVMTGKGVAGFLKKFAAEFTALGKVAELTGGIVNETGLSENIALNEKITNEFFQSITSEQASAGAKELYDSVLADFTITSLPNTKALAENIRKTMTEIPDNGVVIAGKVAKVFVKQLRDQAVSFLTMRPIVVGGAVTVAAVTGGAFAFAGQTSTFTESSLETGFTRNLSIDTNGLSFRENLENAALMYINRANPLSVIKGTVDSLGGFADRVTGGVASSRIAEFTNRVASTFWSPIGKFTGIGPGIESYTASEIPSGIPEAVKAMTLLEAAKRAQNGELNIGDAYINAEGKLAYIAGDDNGVVGASTVAVLTSMLEQSKTATAANTSKASAEPNTTSTNEKSSAQAQPQILDLFGNKVDINKFSAGGLFRDQNTGKVGSVYPGGRGLFEVTPAFVDNIPKDLEALQKSLVNVTDPTKVNLIRDAIAVKETIQSQVKTLGGPSALFGQNEAVLSASATAPEVSKIKENLGDVAQVPVQSSANNSSTGVFNVDATKVENRFRIPSNVGLTIGLGSSTETVGVSQEIYEQIQSIRSKDMNAVQTLAAQIKANPNLVLTPDQAATPLGENSTYGAELDMLRQNPKLVDALVSGASYNSVDKLDAKTNFKGGFTVFIGGPTAFVSGHSSLEKDVTTVWSSEIVGMGGNVKISVPNIDIGAQNAKLEIDDKGTMRYTSSVFNNVGGVSQVKIDLPGGQSIVVSDPATLSDLSKGGVRLEDLISTAIKQSPELAKSLGAIDANNGNSDSLNIQTQSGKKVELFDAIWSTANIYARVANSLGQELQSADVGTDVLNKNVLTNFLDIAANNPEAGAAMLQKIVKFHESGKYYSPTDLYTGENSKLTSEQRAIASLARTLSPEFLDKASKGPITKQDIINEAKGKQFDNLKPILEVLVKNERERVIKNYTAAGISTLPPLNTPEDIKNADNELRRNRFDRRGSSVPVWYTPAKVENLDALKEKVDAVQNARGMADSQAFKANSSGGGSLGILGGNQNEDSRIRFSNTESLTSAQADALVQDIKTNPQAQKVFNSAMSMIGFIPTNGSIGALESKIIVAASAIIKLPIFGIYTEKTEVVRSSNTSNIETVRSLNGTEQENAAKLVAAYEIAKRNMAVYQDSLNNQQNTPDTALKQALGVVPDASGSKWYITNAEGKKILIGNETELNSFVKKVRGLTTIATTTFLEDGSTTPGHKVGKEEFVISTGGETLNSQSEVDAFLSQYTKEDAKQVQNIFESTKKLASGDQAVYDSIRAGRATGKTIDYSPQSFLAAFGVDPDKHYILGHAKYKGGQILPSVIDPNVPGTILEADKDTVESTAKLFKEGKVSLADAFAIVPTIMKNCDNGKASGIGSKPNLSVSGEQSVSSQKVGIAGAERTQSKTTTNFAGQTTVTPITETPPEQTPKKQPAKVNETSPNTPAQPAPGNGTGPTDQPVNGAASGDGTTTLPPQSSPNGVGPNNGLTNGAPNTNVDPNASPTNIAPGGNNPTEAVTSTPVTATDATSNLPVNTVAPNVSPDVSNTIGNAGSDAAATNLPGTLNPGVGADITQGATEVVRTGGSAVVAGDGVIGEVVKPVLR